MLKYLNSLFDGLDADLSSFVETNLLYSDNFMLITVFIIACICITVICTLALFYHFDPPKEKNDENKKIQ